MTRLLALLLLPAAASAQVTTEPTNDLSVHLLLDDVRLDADTRLDLPWRVRHDGSDRSPATRLVATWSTDATPSDDDAFLCEAELASLEADTQLEGRIETCRVPADADGSAWIFLRIDTDAVLWDPDPTNDRDVQRVVVGDHDAAWLSDTALPSGTEPDRSADPASEDVAGCGCAAGGGRAGSLALLGALSIGLVGRRRSPPPR